MRGLLLFVLSLANSSKLLVAEHLCLSVIGEQTAF